MSRCDQHIGLSPEAAAFLDEHRLPAEVCPHCQQAKPREMKIVGKYEGMSESPYPLHRHSLKDGYADEFLQAARWSGGPMFFLGLHVYDSHEKHEGTIVWSEEAINEQL